jgi:uncharacterized protein YutE (UPF0331/DUF86 family)
LVDRNVFTRRLGRLEQLLRNLRRLTELDRDAFLTDEAVQAQAERWTHLAIECAIDLANHLIADQGWKSPTTNKETFQILGQEGVLDANLTRRMEGWAGLRNILVHLYLEVDHGLLFDILVRDLKQAVVEALVQHKGSSTRRCPLASCITGFGGPDPKAALSSSTYNVCRRPDAVCSSAHTARRPLREGCFSYCNAFGLPFAVDLSECNAFGDPLHPEFCTAKHPDFREAPGSLETL